MMVAQQGLEITTRGRGSLDITAAVNAVLRDSGIGCGIANICVHCAG